MSDVRANDFFIWSTDDGDGAAKVVQVRVIRVARDASWADIHCQDGTRFWTKRQPLPFPDSFRPVTR